MKKLILLFLIISLKSQAQGWDFVKWSFNNTDSIEVGSTQYIDIKSVGRVTGTSVLYFSIRKPDQSNSIEVFRENWLNHTDPSKMTPNPDGSYRIYFTIPIIYSSGAFEIYSVSSSLGKKPSGLIKVSQTTSILDEILKSELPNKYYDLLGNEVIPIQDGVYIFNKQKVFLKPLN